MSKTGRSKKLLLPSYIFIKIYSETPGCGKLFRVLTTTLAWKQTRGTRLIVVPNGKKVKN